jgi:tetratricopeptide (TPR) repeat protein
VLAALGVGTITAALVRLRRRWPAGLVAWGICGVSLLPISGILHNGAQLVADRYSYLPCLGLAALAGAGIAAVVEATTRGTLRARVAGLAAAAAVAWIAGLAALTWQQVQVWRTSETLWRSSLEIDPACTICNHHLGLILDGQGRHAAALAHFERGLANNPAHTPSALSLATTLVKVGQPTAAVALLEVRLRQAPEDPALRSHLGFALLEAGRAADAIPHLQAAVRLNPQDPTPLTNLGITLVSVARPRDAVPYLRRAVELNAADPLPRSWLVRAYRGAGDSSAAEAELLGLARIDRERTGARPGSTR